MISDFYRYDNRVSSAFSHVTINGNVRNGMGAITEEDAQRSKGKERKEFIEPRVIIIEHRRDPFGGCCSCLSKKSFPWLMKNGDAG